MRPFPSLMMLSPPSANIVVPAIYYFAVPGSQNFTMVPYNTLVLELWGGGGHGGSAISDSGVSSNGVSSLFYDTLTTPTAGGGEGGYSDGGYGLGGTATGGDINTSGSNGTFTNGGASPNGGLTSNTIGNFPGGGGAGNSAYGGGGAAYCKKTYTPGQLTDGTIYSMFVGSGATVAPGSLVGANGANGQVKITVT